MVPETIQTIYEAAGGLDALQDAGLDSDERLRRVLHRLLCLGKTTTLARYHDSAEDVPDLCASRNGLGTD